MSSCQQFPSLDDLPDAWRPAPGLQRRLRDRPWTAKEQARVDAAIWTAMHELTHYVCKRRSRIDDLGDDGIECFLNSTYAASDMPELVEHAITAARRCLEVLIEDWLERGPAKLKCRDYGYLISCAIYADALLPAEDERRMRLIRMSNAALKSCNSFARAIGRNYRKTLTARKLSNAGLYDLIMWATTILDAQTIEGLHVPRAAKNLVPAVWRACARYPFKSSRAYTERAADWKFYDDAYLATHVGYVPTGYGRHPIYVEDAPWLYRFLRESFYDVLQLGELDLLAEFVDLLRQYGCTAEEDVMVRDGTRFLMKLFRSAGGSWIAHREPCESKRPSPYDLIHKPWTAIAGIRSRVPEPPVAGTYGHVFRAHFPAPGHGAA